MTTVSYYNSPIGVIAIQTDENTIRSIMFADDTQPPKTYAASELIDQCTAQLSEYFAGKRTEFSLSLSSEGTAFEKNVWSALQNIPFAQTCSYLDIANRRNNPGAIRAVGRANGANPIAIIIPCHRVIGSDGSLTGYGGGLWRKRWLLDHEARVAGTSLF